MNIKNSDYFFAPKTSSEYEPSMYDTTFEKKMSAARRGIKKYRNALIELSK